MLVKLGGIATRVPFHSASHVGAASAVSIHHQMLCTHVITPSKMVLTTHKRVHAQRAP